MKKKNYSHKQINETFELWNEKLDIKTSNELAWHFMNNKNVNFYDFVLDAIKSYSISLDAIPSFLKKDIDFLADACKLSTYLLNEIEREDNNLYIKVILEMGKRQNEIKIADDICVK